MFTSSRNNSEYSILECPQIRPLTTTIKWKSNNIEIAPNCPRCASSNTKFCYYNNYSLSQPRYFCKGCRRYWTKGGSLRNVPIGGGCRKSRRSRAPKLQGSERNSFDSEVAVESENDTSIDLAAVFAKYVNHQNIDNQQDGISSPGGSCSASESSSGNFQARSSNIESQMDDISTMFEYQKQVDLISTEVNDQLQTVFPQISMHEDVNGKQDFLWQNSNAFEMHNTLGDEISPNLLWGDGTDLTNFGLQHTMEQFQDFGLFSIEEQLRIPANLVNDGWPAFDPSVYEIFSRH